MRQSEIEHNKRVVFKYLKENGAIHTIGNVHHAQKAFMVNSVLQWVLAKVDSGEYGSGDVSFYLDSMSDYINDKIKIHWSKEGNLVIGA
jgi:hypothetical protein